MTVTKSRLLLIVTLILACIVLGLISWNSSLRMDVRMMSSIQDVFHKVTVETKSRECLPLPNRDVLKTLTREQLAQLYHSYVNNVQISCDKIVRFGNAGDGGWDVCVSYPYNTSKSCLVYSFGIENDWSFDDAIAKTLGCQVHSYDPSISLNDHQRLPNLRFHNTGLNNSDNINSLGWRMRKLSSILKENNHTDTLIDVLKIDIEFSEWSAFPEMITSGALKNVKQFCFEIHIKLNPHPEPSSEMYIRGLTLLKDLYKSGFRIFRTHKNMDAKYKSVFGMERTGCHELYMVRNDVRTFGETSN